MKHTVTGMILRFGPPADAHGDIFKKGSVMFPKHQVPIHMNFNPIQIMGMATLDQREDGIYATAEVPEGLLDMSWAIGGKVILSNSGLEIDQISYTKQNADPAIKSLRKILEGDPSDLLDDLT